MRPKIRSYPRSFRRMLAIGFVLVAVPAAFGLVTIAVSVSGIASQAERLVYQAMSATQAGRELAEAVATLERNARQLVILDDKSLLETYDANRRGLLEAIERFGRLDVGADTRAAVESVASIEAQVQRVLAGAEGTDADRAAAIARFVRLRELSGRIQRGSADRVDREVEALRDTAVRLRRVALGYAFALVPVIALLIVGFTVLITRPIRELDSAIRRLGSGQFGEPVQVGGPDDLVELGRRLDWMRNALISLEQDKNRFMREIAHSLKTNLAALREGAELLADPALGTLDDEQREIVDILRRNAVELQGLIVGLLQYGQAQLERSALRPTDWSLRDMVEATVEKHKLELRAGRIAVDREIDAATVRADRGKIAAILDNLMSNAIKYSPPDGTIHVQARVTQAGLVVDVADEGPGVVAEERERIFDPFVQGRAVASGLVPGSGVGLSIAREHAIAHGGTIELLDAKRGAHFRVNIPLEVA